MNKSFRNIQGSKNRASSTTFISLHFNKADEEQLEISYGEKDGATSKATKKEENLSEPTSSSENKLSDYESRFRFGNARKPPDQNEGWMFFKDFKGKLTKTLEERKSSISRGVKDDKAPSESDPENKKNLDDIDYDSTPTENVIDKLSCKLSPAIEAAEVESDNSLFADYIDNRLEKARCEIISTKSATPAATSQFFLKQPSKSQVKKDINMTLSTLITNRQPSYEAVLEKDDKKDQDEVDVPLIRSEETENPQNLADLQSENQLNKLPLIVRKYNYFVKTYWNSIIFRILVGILSLLFVPIPSWISGFIAGAILSGYFVHVLFTPGKPREAFTIPDYSQLPPSNIPVLEVEDESIIYKGWMNELPFDLSYNTDTYHVNCTRSLFIRLDGSYLRVSYPQKNIPKRAMFNEPRYELQFIHQQHYDITGSTVELLPVGLAKKRLWSKKYPICLRIPNPKQSVLSSFAKDISDFTMPSKSTSRKEYLMRKYIPRINENNEVVLYLFSRTDREKDLWYNRFKKASRIKLLKSHSPSSSPNIAAIDTCSLENKRTISVDLATLQLSSKYGIDESLDDDDIDGFTDLTISKQEKFKLYMSLLLNPVNHDYSISSNLKDKKDDRKLSKSSSTSQNNLTWLNVLIGRVFFDFLTEEVWAKLVAEKIQKKLSKIKLPVFLKELTVKDINLGTALPKIHRASEPTVDQRGIWIDIDLSYNGFFQMTLETKINLLRYKCDSDELSLSDVSKDTVDSMEQILKSPVYNSDEEDSAESSSDDDIPLPDVNTAASTDESSTAGGSTGKKLLRLVDRFAQSTYFQQAAKNKYIKKAMEDISNTPLILTVEVQWLTGTLALNIPPIPTDRLWYGFRTNPHLSIVARPKLGQHVVTLTHVTEWIEKKLVSEFQKILVIPNMDDLVIPVMLSDLDLPKV
ncbi:testis-expressed protein 2 [Caerostris darwini]|uniref:Testis-expressed protein 2 n=1 Tax=Caerostris darwini TaxID=1538125 RepID=A0AAV4WTA5_9ARAC|nr:testis-expressed protein 2 [Caerostris darwini]